MTPQIEAHRGDSSNAPENTLAAFERANRLGISWIELDVHPAKDGTLMVIHDDTVGRTTDGSGAVCEMSLDELLTLDAGVKFSPEFTGEKIPRLCDVLQKFGSGATRLNVEIKASRPGFDVPQTVAELLHRFDKQRRHVVSSFDLQSLLDVRAIDSELTLALIGNGPEILAQAEHHRLPWIHCKHTTMTGAIVARAHEQGISVNVWTVDDPATIPFWKAIGVDKVCTNRPALWLAGCDSDSDE
ncbi:MAG: glycerophosphodiester phosphodiesterase family protein [Verrucomicrobiota bacterium]